MLLEGIYDKYINKAIFILGGAGSGKTFISNEFVGIGLKSMDNDREFMHMLKKHGHVDSDNRVDLNTIGDYSHIRAHAKNLNQSVEAGYLDGHLGLVIQGTGKDLDDVTKHKTYLESFGYDSFCIFINTSLEVSLARNRNRKRVMPDEIVKKSWENAQHNIGSF